MIVTPFGAAHVYVYRPYAHTHAGQGVTHSDSMCGVQDGVYLNFLGTDCQWHSGTVLACHSVTIWCLMYS